MDAIEESEDEFSHDDEEVGGVDVGPESPVFAVGEDSDHGGETGQEGQREGHIAVQHLV